MKWSRWFSVFFVFVFVDPHPKGGGFLFFDVFICMKIQLTESQYNKVIDLIEAETQEQECTFNDIDVLNTFLEGIVEFDETTLGPETSIEELSTEIKDPKTKLIFKQLDQRLNSLSADQLKDELKKVLAMKNLQEQGTPYTEQTVDIAGMVVPKVVVHGAIGLIAIAILSKLFKFLGAIAGGMKSSNRRGYSRLASKSVGCQGGAARARLVRRRRRRENWRSFLRKVGLR